MKKILKLLGITVVALLCVVFPSQAQGKYDELQAVITSDKEDYVKGESAEITIAVTNQSKQTISNVEVECLLPKGLRLVDGDASTASIEKLESEKTLTMVVHVEAAQTSQILPTPQTGDGTNFWSVSLVFIAAIIICLLCLWLRKEKGISYQRLFSVFVLALLMTGMGILSHKTIVQASAGEIVSFQESKQIRVEGEKYDMVFQITYERPQDTSSSEEGSEDTAPSSEALGLVDFVVEVEDGREPVVLQLSDTQIIDPTQDRRSTPLGQGEKDYWAPEKIDERLYSSLTETIEATNPDLILLTGDLVYGEFDDNGTMLESLIAKMESFGIPWAPVFGNHDNESAMGVDWQCEQFVKAEHCLFEQRTLTGNGNYTVGIKQDGVLKRVFFMMDSNGCGAMHANSIANGHSQSTVGFGQDQMDWSINLAQEIKGISPDTKISYAFHIQIAAFADAYAKYEFTNNNTINNPINIDKLENKAESDFGYIGRDLKNPWDTSYTFYNRMKAVGVDSIFVGHEHCNSASVVYDGIRFQYSQKIGTYDRANFVTESGEIQGGYCLDYSNTALEPMSGGTVMKLSEKDGSIVEAYIYLCGDAQAKLDETYKDPEEESTIVVNGLQYGTELTKDGAITVEAVTIADANAWKCTAISQGKVFIDPSLIQNKTKFTFSVYVPSESTSVMQLSDGPLFAMRFKESLEVSKPTFGTCQGGYIIFSTTTEKEGQKLEYGKWQTFTVDLSEMPATCIEFAFNIASGNVIYLKDVAFQ